MQTHESNLLDHRNQDKVRIRIGDYKGHKGIIRNVTQENLEVLLDNGHTIQIAPSEVTNQSLAARKAWSTMRSKVK